MVRYDDMTPEERDRFIYLVLSEDAIKAIILIMRKRYGADVSTDAIMRFAFKCAVNRMTPAHLKHKPAGPGAAGKEGQ
ncbi:MAG: hypothetical protein E4H36_15650 [Spirochaetales bacterium]|nr:MAG: hypothetical protein E4H36_15650 [Spirochaetales bacterium]